MNNKVTAQVQFSCKACASHELKLIAGVKTADDKTYLICQCECGETVPLEIDAIQMKLFEIAPLKGLVN